jgi:hypothetical protein
MFSRLLFSRQFLLLLNQASIFEAVRAVAKIGSSVKSDHQIGETYIA